MASAELSVDLMDEEDGLDNVYPGESFERDYVVEYSGDEEVEIGAELVSSTHDVDVSYSPSSFSISSDSIEKVSVEVYVPMDSDLGSFNMIHGFSGDGELEAETETEVVEVEDEDEISDLNETIEDLENDIEFKQDRINTLSDLLSEIEEGDEPVVEDYTVDDLLEMISEAEEDLNELESEKEELLDDRDEDVSRLQEEKDSLEEALTVSQAILTVLLVFILGLFVVYWLKPEWVFGEDNSSFGEFLDDE